MVDVRRRGHPHLPELAVLLAIGHAAIVVLALIGRTAPYVTGGRHHLDGFLALADGAPLWVPLHIIAAAGIVASVTGIGPKRWSDQACHLSAGVYLAWGGMTFVWAATRQPPVSLLGPTLTLILAGVAFWAAAVWDDNPED